MPVPAVTTFDAACDAAEAHLFSVAIITFLFRVRRRDGGDLLLIGSVQDRVARGFGQLFPRRVQGKTHGEAEAVHHLPVPGIRVVLERFVDEAAVPDTSMRVRNQQFRVSELVDSKAAACAARTFGIVEHKIGGPDIAIYKMMRPAGKRCVEPARLLLAGAFADMDLHQAVTHEQRARDSGLDGFLVFPAHDETVHNGVHVPDTGFVPSIEVNFFRNIDRCAVNDQPPATLLA